MLNSVVKVNQIYDNIDRGSHDSETLILNIWNRILNWEYIEV